MNNNITNLDSKKLDSIKDERAGNQYTHAEIRPYQVEVEKALNYRVIDLFQDNENDRRLISRADVILILTLYKNGFDEFLEDYKKYVSDLRETKGYRFVVKPHHYLKNILG